VAVQTQYVSPAFYRFFCLCLGPGGPISSPHLHDTYRSTSMSRPRAPSISQPLSRVPKRKQPNYIFSGNASKYFSSSTNFPFCQLLFRTGH
jgi:hypothetical protein